MHTANTQQISQKLGDKMSNFNFKNCPSIIVVHYIVLQSIKETAKKNLILRVTSFDQAYFYDFNNPLLQLFMQKKALRSLEAEKCPNKNHGGTN